MLNESLQDMAHRAAINAHCPYSNFHVGCALEADDGRFFTGCNVENASYGLTICSERNALFAMIANGARKFRRLHVCCPDAGDNAPPQYKMPCGACRQVMAEFAADDAEIIVDGVGTFTMGSLLPSPFKI